MNNITDDDFIEYRKGRKRRREEERVNWFLFGCYAVANLTAAYVLWYHAPKGAANPLVLEYLRITFPICLIMMYYLLVRGARSSKENWESDMLQMTRVVGQVASIVAVPALVITTFAAWIMPVFAISYLLCKVGVPSNISAALAIPATPLIFIIACLGYKKFWDWVDGR
jgi:hypothetical protein